MPTSIESIIIIMLSVYGVIITYLVYDYYPNQELYMKDKVDYINNKTMEVSARERVISGREACDKELMRIKTIHKSALDVLNSYNTLTTPL